MKDNNKTAHWVGHDKFKTLDIDEFFKENKLLITYKLVQLVLHLNSQLQEEKKNPFFL